MLQQIFEITLMNLRNVNSRRGASSVIVVGIAGVVAVLIGLLSMAAGFSAALKDSSRPDRAIVMRAGSSDELDSWLDQRRNEHRQATAGNRSARAVNCTWRSICRNARRTRRRPWSVAACEAEAFAVRPELHIVAGRTFTPGHNEMLVGAAAAREYVGLEVGDRVELRDQPWTVVGHFETDGSATESEVWMDLATAQSVFRRSGAVNSIRVQLQDPGQIGSHQRADRRATRAYALP